MRVVPIVHTTDDDYETLSMMASPENDTPTSPTLSRVRQASTNGTQPGPDDDEDVTARCVGLGGAHGRQRLVSDPTCHYRRSS